MRLFGPIFWLLENFAKMDGNVAPIFLLLVDSIFFIPEGGRFRAEANQYMLEARDTTSVEVAQAQATVESNYHNVLQYTRQAAEAEVGAQRDNLIREAQAAMAQQKANIVAEAENYVAASSAHIGEHYQTEYKESWIQLKSLFENPKTTMKDDPAPLTRR